MRKLLYILFLLVFPVLIFAQSREQLRIRQKLIENKIIYLKNLKANTGRSAQQIVLKLQLLENEMKQQDSLIVNLKNQNVQTVTQINSYLDEQTRLQTRFNNLKDEYAKVLMSYAKTRNAYSDWMFILASDNLNGLYKRFVYLNQYSDYRKSQAREIKKTEDRLSLVIDSINLEKLAQEKLIMHEQAELDTLESLKGERLKILAVLRAKQGELKRKLAEVELKQKAVNKDVLGYILDDRKSRQVKNQVVDLAKKGNKRALLNKIFGSSRGKLPWPVRKGIIVKRFGIYHPITMRNISLRNDGVDIQTNMGADVKAVFQGKVVKMINVPGLNKAVLVQNGDYYVLYSNLKYVSVKLGSSVKQGQILGKVYGDSTEENTAILKFQIWKGQQKLNPEKWLRKGSI